MDVDFDAALDGFLSEKKDVRKKATDALEKWRMRDPGGLSALLIKNIVVAKAEVQSQETMEPGTPRESSSAASGILPCDGRVLAAILLRQVLTKSAKELASKDGQCPWSHPGLAGLLLEAAAASIPDAELRRHVADALATAATIQFAFGHSWPELNSVLGRWCNSGRDERAFVLRMMEQLSDEMETFKTTQTGHINQDGSLVTLLCFLESHGNCLRTLLQASLLDSGDEVSRDSAARIYTQCVMGPDLPDLLREVVKDLASILAEAASTPAASSCAITTPHATRIDLSEACLQAVALAAHADPGTWAHLALASHGSSEATLIAPLALTVADAKASPEVRAAALTALLELSVAAIGMAVGSDECQVDIAADQLASCVARANASLMSELPSDETVDLWAECLDETSEKPDLDHDGDGSEGLLQIALDVAERLVALPRCSVSAGLTCGGGVEGFATAARELLRKDAWQARHAALLILLRLAFCRQCSVFAIADCNPRPAAANAFALAFQHLTFAHPRVRWAALEVLARLFAADSEALGDGVVLSQIEFAQVFEMLLAIVTRDAYLRVRRHALVVLVAAANSQTPLFTPPQVAPLFNEVLIPLTSCEDEAVVHACAHIARYLALEAPSKGMDLGVNGLWEQFCEKARTAKHLQVGESLDVQIDWPADWR